MSLRPLFGTGERWIPLCCRLRLNLTCVGWVGILREFGYRWSSFELEVMRQFRDFNFLFAIFPLSIYIYVWSESSKKDRNPLMHGLEAKFKGTFRFVGLISTDVAMSAKLLPQTVGLSTRATRRMVAMTIALKWRFVDERAAILHRNTKLDSSHLSEAKDYLPGPFSTTACEKLGQKTFWTSSQSSRRSPNFILSPIAGHERRPFRPFRWEHNTGSNCQLGDGKRRRSAETSHPMSVM